MTRLLPTATGALNAMFAVFHIWLFFQIVAWPPDFPNKGLVEALAAGGTLMIAFLAAALLLYRRDTMNTSLGQAALTLGAVVYLSRAIEEFFWFHTNPAIVVACLIAGGLHAALAVPAMRRN